jgi:hypothetical protein
VLSTASKAVEEVLGEPAAGTESTSAAPSSRPRGELGRSWSLRVVVSPACQPPSTGRGTQRAHPLRLHKSTMLSGVWQGPPPQKSKIPGRALARLSRRNLRAVTPGSSTSLTSRGRLPSRLLTVNSCIKVRL